MNDLQKKLMNFVLSKRLFFDFNSESEYLREKENNFNTPLLVYKNGKLGKYISSTGNTIFIFGETPKIFVKDIIRFSANDNFGGKYYFVQEEDLSGYMVRGAIPLYAYLGEGEFEEYFEVCLEPQKERSFYGLGRAELERIKNQVSFEISKKGNKVIKYTHSSEWNKTDEYGALSVFSKFKTIEAKSKIFRLIKKEYEKEWFLASCESFLLDFNIF